MQIRIAESIRGGPATCACTVFLCLKTLTSATTGVKGRFVKRVGDDSVSGGSAGRGDGSDELAMRGKEEERDAGGEDGAPPYTPSFGLDPPLAWLSEQGISIS